MFKYVKLLLLSLVLASVLTGCASTNRKVFVYGFGTMSVSKTATIAQIDELVNEQYGAPLMWSFRK